MSLLIKTTKNVRCIFNSILKYIPKLARKETILRGQILSES